jgi:hypothetical protein
VWLYVLPDELHDVVHRSAGLEDGGNSDFLEALNILIGDDAADQHQNVVHFVLFQQIHDTRNDGIVRPGEYRKTDDLHIFLERGVNHHLRRLAQTGIDDLHASIAERASDHLGPAVVTVETGLRYQDADFAVSGHRHYLSTWCIGNTARTRRSLSPYRAGARIQLGLHAQLPKQERINVGTLFDLLRYRLTLAVAGFGFDAK